MPNWMFELLIAALVVTSLATGGVLGLWAATSRWHWFARIMVIASILMPLLWRPISEAFITLVVEVAVIVTGIYLYLKKWPTWRFSIAGLLLLIVPLSFLLIAVKRLEAQPWSDWMGSIEFGIEGGSIVLFGCWFWCHPSSRRKRVIAFLAALPILSFGWCWSNYMDNFISFFVLSGGINWSEPKMIAVRTLYAMLSVVMLIGIISIPLLVFRYTESRNGRHCWQWIAGCITVVVAVYPAWVAWWLSNPLPVPAQTPSASLAFDALVEIGNNKAFTTIDTLAAGGTIDWQAMHLAVKAAAADFDRMRQIIREPITISVDYKEISTKHIDARGALRDIARRFSYAADAAQRAGDTNGVIDACVSLLRLAYQLEGQGLQSDCLTTSSFESMALAHVYKSVPVFDALQTKQLAELLLAHNLDRPSLDPMWRRERIYNENIYGWHGHLVALFDCRLKFFSVSLTREQINWIIQKRNAALSTLIATEMALRTHALKLGSHPQHLSELVPEYLPSVPIDPCSKADEPIIYHCMDQSYQLYSRGYDGDDDGGIPCSSKLSWLGINSIDWTSNGDLLLEAYYADEKEQ